MGERQSFTFSMDGCRQGKPSNVKNIVRRGNGLLPFFLINLQAPKTA
jgi:hypothetical protein